MLTNNQFLLKFLAVYLCQKIYNNHLTATATQTKILGILFSTQIFHFIDPIPCNSNLFKAIFSYLLSLLP